MPYYKSPNNAIHYLSDTDIINGGEELLPLDSVSISDEEANSLRPAPVVATPSSVTMRQARIALYQAGLLQTVNNAIANMPGVQGDAARIEWEFSNDVLRNQPLVLAMKPILGLTDDQLDQLFITASNL